ncbi:hypothetical protein [Maridesulfovibrio sp.]|uniref:hypothetical protein n=1 Tax=Maridesulfovibrio sp. TaxID=2795000 RepID=UPI002A1887D5|nr:hypothetical protein [Maridesulfovibrio sp.]
MGKEHQPETVFKAQELYCVLRLSMASVSKEVGVATSTLWRWCDKYGWKEKRANIAQAECDIRADTIMARSEMLKTLIKTKNAQVGFAVAGLEKLALDQAEAERAGRAADRKYTQTTEIKTTDDIARALREAVTMKLAELLDDPTKVDLKTVSDIQKASKIIEEMESKSSKDKDLASGNGVSADNLGKMLDALK